MRSALRDRVAELLMQAIEHRERSIMVFWLRAYCQVATGSDSPSVPFSRLAEFVRRHEREVRWCEGSGEAWGWALVTDSGLFRRGEAEGVTIAPEYRHELSLVCEKATAYWAFLKAMHRRRHREGLPGVLREAALLWRNHLFFEFHELLEGVWMDWRGPERRFLQGLIQLGVAFYHVQRNNYRGAMSMFRNGRAKVALHVPRYRGVELTKFLEEIDKCREALEGLGPRRCPDFDWSLLPSFQVGGSG
ncbi:MAG: DUF309 domain-containing protein [Candidatus Methylomirabilales bacterium]